MLVRFSVLRRASVALPKQRVHFVGIPGMDQQRAVEGMREVFSKGAERSRGDHEGEIRDLHAKIGE